MNINWYPGHMKKSIDKIRESLKLVNIVAEIVDSRIPISSRNPVIDQILESFPRIIILNKVDMANPKETRKWIKYFNEKDISVIEYNSTKDNRTNDLYKVARNTLEPLFLKRKEKQIQDEKIKMMVVGIPNVGKSTFINNVSQKRGTKVGNRPGVTKMNQWIRTSSDLLLLDTPGVLWPKLDLPDGGKNLAFTGAIKDEILQIEDLCFELVKKLQSIALEDLNKRYELEDGLTTIEIMDSVALKFGAIKKGKEIDYFKVANIIIDDFRKVRIGRISLETVEEVV